MIMAVIAYLRVSTEKQYLENQHEEIERFASKHGLKIDRWYTETVSGCVCSKDRKLANLLSRMKPGDALVVTEISRLSRTLLEIMTILNTCISKNVRLYSTKEGYVFQNDINSKVLGFAFGLIAEIERNLISMRTKEALARRRQEGKKLGRAFGSRNSRYKLTGKEAAIRAMLEAGASKAAVCRRFHCTYVTLERHLKRCCGGG